MGFGVFGAGFEGICVGLEMGGADGGDAGFALGSELGL